MPAVTLPARTERDRANERKNDSDGRTMNAEATENETDVLKGPKDKAVSH